MSLGHLNRRRTRLGAVATLTLALLFAGFALLAPSASAGTTPGSSADNPIWVNNPSDVPSGAVVTSGPTTNPTTCQTTETWTLKVPGTKEITHEVYLYKRHGNAVAPDKEYQWPKQTRTWIPATQPQTHEEYKYSKTVPGQHHNAVTGYKYKRDETSYEVKNIKDMSFDASAPGSTTYNGVTLAGKWKSTPGTNGQVPFKFIQAAGINPIQMGLKTNTWYYNLPGGTYGLPSGKTYSYEFTLTTTKPADWPSSGWQSFTTTWYYTGSGDGSTNASDAVAVATSPGGAWQSYGSPVVITAAYDDPSTTVLYNNGNWTRDVLGAPWVQTDHQTVTDVPGVSAHWSDYVDDGYTPWGPDATKPADTDTTRYGYVGTQYVGVSSRDKAGTGSAAWDEVYPTTGVLGNYSTYTSDANPALNVVTGNPGDTQVPWSKWDEHTVVDQEATSGTVTYYAWNDHASCPAVTPAGVQFKEQCGTANDQYYIPTSTGAQYLVDNKVISSGWHQGVGTVSVTAQATQGHTLSGTKSWSHHFTNEACPSGKPSASLVARCNCKGSATLHNHGTKAVTLRVSFIKANGAHKVLHVLVPAHATKVVKLKGLKHYSVAKVTWGKKLLDKVKVPGRCAPAPPTGLRVVVPFVRG